MPAPLPSPPRARLTLRVGIVGHRPNRLGGADMHALGALIESVLIEVKQAVEAFHRASDDRHLYSSAKDDMPVLRAISPLAEGTDRLFAGHAVGLGYALCCPMPFAQEEFEKDFVSKDSPPDSTERFRELLDRARKGPGLTTFELDGNRAPGSNPYGAAGRVVLNQSDLLVVVWDGGPSAGEGGTVQTLEEAVRYHVPVIWIDAVAPHPWRLMREKEDLACLATGTRCTPAAAPSAQTETLGQVISRVVVGELALPVMQKDVNATRAIQEHAEAYFGERKPARNMAFVWKLFRNALGSREFLAPVLKVQDFEDHVRWEWPTSPADVENYSPPDGPLKAEVGTAQAASWALNAALRPHYAWSDKLADLYADRYRSMYVLAYLLSAAAVFLALLPVAAGWTERSPDLVAWTIAAELTTVGVILLLLRSNERSRCHERWMEYRLYAEFVRQLRFLIPLGGGRPFLHVPAHLAVYGAPTQTWMFWQVRATARAVGIPHARVTPEYVGAVLSYLARVVGTQAAPATNPGGKMDSRAKAAAGATGQLGFHLITSMRSRNIHSRLQRTVHVLFQLTVACIVLHLLPHLPLDSIGLPVVHLSERLESWLTLACAALPALGAALAGIDNQGEFARIEKRSEAMVQSFEDFAESKLRGLEERAAKGQLGLSDLATPAADIAQLMVDEVADWRVVFTDRSKTSV